MDQAEAKRRDKVLRDYFEGRTWDKSPEFMLMRHIGLERHDLLKPFPYLVDYEWEVADGFSQHGRGDLVFGDGHGAFAVVEVKVVEGGRLGGTGRNRRTSMRKKRRKVEEQAWEYALAWLRLQGVHTTTRAFLFTNESGLVQIGDADLEAPDDLGTEDNDNEE